MAVMPARRSWFQRLKPADRAAFAAFAALAVLGPSLVRLAGRTLEPSESVAVAWAEAGIGPSHRDTSPPAEPPGALDPWGRPFRWTDRSMSFMPTDGGPCAFLEGCQAVSDGPDPDDASDDIEVDFYDGASSMSLSADLLTESPGLGAWGLVVWLAAAWRVLRREPRRGRLVELALVTASAAPSVAIAWTVASSERGPALVASWPRAVPGPLAITLTICGLALVAALAVRLLSRPPEAS